ncbi:hypothetical protein [uncultured Clostridium sp.]|uniref:hypothetical protein n=1 Tax=uncultured Clostridium sp. TaxID=59620 RepID=UPI0026110BB0|nr:hypothetical protein [uncultured Clostridium sp.]
MQNKSFIIQQYLFLGNSLIHNNITYKMDQNLNVYIVNNEGKASKFITIVNSNAYVLFIEIAMTIDNDYYKHIKSMVYSSSYFK